MSAFLGGVVLFAPYVIVVFGIYAIRFRLVKKWRKDFEVRFQELEYAWLDAVSLYLLGIQSERIPNLEGSNSRERVLEGLLQPGGGPLNERLFYLIDLHHRGAPERQNPRWVSDVKQALDAIYKERDGFPLPPPGWVYPHLTYMKKLLKSEKSLLESEPERVSRFQRENPL